LPRYSHAHTLFRYCVFSRSRPPPTSTLFPYTTLFRSSAIARRLAREGCEILTADHAALDLADQRQTEQWLGHEKPDAVFLAAARSEEHTSELQSRGHLVCRLLLEKKNVLRHER